MQVLCGLRQEANHGFDRVTKLGNTIGEVVEMQIRSATVLQTGVSPRGTLASSLSLIGLMCLAHNVPTKTDRISTSLTLVSPSKRAFTGKPL
jgi:hypothetical protein